MFIDTHTHGKLAKNLPFSEQFTIRLFQEAKKRGVEALCLTEHFNTRDFDKIYAYIHDHYPREGDTFLVEGVRVFPGIEVDMAEGGHNLVIGSYETIIALREEILRQESSTEFLPAARLFPLIKQYDVIFGAAHVFRKGCHNLELPEELIAYYDFFDLNGKDMGVLGPNNYQKVMEVVAYYDKPVLAGSDTHQYLQYGSVTNHFVRHFQTIAAFREEMLQGDYEVIVNPAVAEKVEGANLVKKVLKQLQRQGGSYDFPLAIE